MSARGVMREALCLSFYGTDWANTSDFRRRICDDMARDGLAALSAAGLAVLPVEPTPIWVHEKRGTAYREVGRATLQAATGPAAEGDTLVIYRGDDGRLWAREVHEFEDGRFVLVAAAVDEAARHD